MRPRKCRTGSARERLAVEVAGGGGVAAPSGACQPTGAGLRALHRRERLLLGLLPVADFALVRVGTIAVDAAPHLFQHAIALALAAGATSDETVASLEAVTPVTGADESSNAPEGRALALGYYVDAPLERYDP